MRKRNARWLMILGCLLVWLGSATIVTAQLGEEEPPRDLDMNGGPPQTGDFDLLDCNPENVLCDALPPQCFRAGTVPVVVDGCWGECVEFSQCAPIFCNDSAQCPAGTTYCHQAGICASDDSCSPAFPDSCSEEYQLALLLLSLL